MTRGTVKLELPSGSQQDADPDNYTSEICNGFSCFRRSTGLHQSCDLYSHSAERRNKNVSSDCNGCCAGCGKPAQGSNAGAPDRIISNTVSASDDWEWLNLGLYDLKNGYTEPNAKDNFDIAAIIRNRKLGGADVMTDLARVTLMLTARGYDCSKSCAVQ